MKNRRVRGPGFYITLSCLATATRKYSRETPKSVRLRRNGALPEAQEYRLMTFPQAAYHSRSHRCRIRRRLQIPQTTFSRVAFDRQSPLSQQDRLSTRHGAFLYQLRASMIDYSDSLYALGTHTRSMQNRSRLRARLNPRLPSSHLRLGLVS